MKLNTKKTSIKNNKVKTKTKVLKLKLAKEILKTMQKYYKVSAVLHNGLGLPIDILSQEKDVPITSLQYSQLMKAYKAIKLHELFITVTQPKTADIQGMIQSVESADKNIKSFVAALNNAQVYAHMAKIDLENAEKLKRGEKI